MFPFIDTAPRAAKPVVVLALITANLVVFLWMWTLPQRELDYVLVSYALIPIRYTNPAVARFAGLDPSNWWPLLTNTFMHGGWLHVLLNMWFLWIFGPAMEARFGRFLFALLYLGGGFMASVVHLVTHPTSSEPALGASGAIAAVIAAYAVTYPTARVVTIVPIVIIPLFLPIPAILFALIWFGLQVVQGTSELASPHFAGGVAWWAHIGGFVFGSIFALFFDFSGADMHVSTTTWNRRGRRGPDVRWRSSDRL